MDGDGVQPRPPGSEQTHNCKNSTFPILWQQAVVTTFNSEAIFGGMSLNLCASGPVEFSFENVDVTTRFEWIFNLVLEGFSLNYNFVNICV